MIRTLKGGHFRARLSEFSAKSRAACVLVYRVIIFSVIVKKNA